MSGRVRSWPVRAVPAGTPEDVALSRRVAATLAHVETRPTLAEPETGDGWVQPSLFSPWQVAA